MENGGIMGRVVGSFEEGEEAQVAAMEVGVNV
jgi:hypothetical protein